MATETRDAKDPSRNASNRRRFLATAATAATSAGLAGGADAFRRIARLAGREQEVLGETGARRPGHDPCLAQGREGRFSRKA